MELASTNAKKTVGSFKIEKKIMCTRCMILVKL